MTGYQVMPRLSADEYADLEQSIKTDGVLVPIIVSPGGEIIDGHHRAEIARRHGLHCPEVVKHGDATELRTFAYSLNLNRRHLTREQRRDLIAQSLRQDPQLADTVHAKRTGASDKTVTGVRDQLEATSEIPKLDRTVGADGRERPAARPAIAADAARQFAASDADYARQAADMERELREERHQATAPEPTPVLGTDGKTYAARSKPRLPEPVLAGDRLARYDGEKRSEHLGAACMTLSALTEPLPRRQYIDAWRDYPEGASPAQRDRVGPEHFRAYADALHTLADEWENSRA